MPKKVCEVAGCEGCPMRRLYPDNTFVAPKHANAEHDLVRLAIAEAPGADEAVAGEPLVGGAGKWFDSILRKAGIDRRGMTLANVLQCRPPDNIFPTDNDARKYISREDAERAVSHCLTNHLLPLIHSRAWNRIDLFGDKPLRYLAGRGDGISVNRGSPLRVEGRPAVATFHPAYIMRDQTMFPVAVNDLLKSTEQPPEYYNLFPSLQDVQDFTATEFAFDIETDRRTNEITMVGLCAQPYFAMAVPFRGPYISELKRIFGAAKSIIGHNCIQFDLPFLRRAGVDTDADLWDTMLLQHLCFPDFPHDLEFVGSQFCSKPAWKSDKELFQRYNCRDVDVTLQCFKQLKPLVEQYNLLDLYKLVQVPLAKICRLMHETGFKVDTNRIIYVREKLLKQRDEEEKALPEWLRSHEEPCKKREPAPKGTLGKSGKPVKYILRDSSVTVVPWRSPAVKQQYLYGKEHLGWEPILDPKSGRVTTGKVALAKIKARLLRAGKPEYRIVEALERLNKLDELITTFAKADMVKIDRMHPHFNVHGTASGRLSSSEPNLQNIPESARVIYVPSHAGWKIVDVDYSQIENRLTAHFAGDTERLARFVRDPKFSEHRYAASLFLGIRYEDVEKDNDKDAPYGKAKRIVHGTNYGMGPQKIANLYDMDFRDIKKLQDTWKQAIWPTIKWQARIGEQAKHDGYLRTPFGRLRFFYTASYYTEALSFLPQSTAADVVFRAMIGLMYKKIGWPEDQARRVVGVVEAIPDEARLLLQVHDSLVFECPAELVDTLVATVRRVMCQPWPELGGLAVPIGIKVGDSWGEAEEYETQRAAA